MASEHVPDRLLSPADRSSPAGRGAPLVTQPLPSRALAAFPPSLVK